MNDSNTPILESLTLAEESLAYMHPFRPDLVEALNITRKWLANEVTDQEMIKAYTDTYGAFTQISAKVSACMVSTYATPGSWRTYDELNRVREECHQAQIMFDIVLCVSAAVDAAYLGMLRSWGGRDFDYSRRIEDCVDCVRSTAAKIKENFNGQQTHEENTSLNL